MSTTLRKHELGNAACWCAPYLVRTPAGLLLYHQDRVQRTLKLPGPWANLWQDATDSEFTTDG